MKIFLPFSVPLTFHFFTLPIQLIWKKVNSFLKLNQVNIPHSFARLFTVVGSMSMGLWYKRTTETVVCKYGNIHQWPVDALKGLKYSCFTLFAYLEFFFFRLKQKVNKRRIYFELDHYRELIKSIQNNK